jgi:hypothetical protein
MSHAREIQAPYSRIVRDRENGLTIVERQALKRWVESAWAQAVAPIFGEGGSYE